MFQPNFGGSGPLVMRTPFGQVHLQYFCNEITCQVLVTYIFEHNIFSEHLISGISSLCIVHLYFKNNKK